MSVHMSIHMSTHMAIHMAIYISKKGGGVYLVDRQADDRLRSETHKHKVHNLDPHAYDTYGTVPKEHRHLLG